MYITSSICINTWVVRIDHCLFSHSFVDPTEVILGMDDSSILHFMSTSSLHHYETTLYHWFQIDLNQRPRDRDRDELLLGGAGVE